MEEAGWQQRQAWWGWKTKEENGPEFGIRCHWQVTLIELGRHGSKSVFIHLHVDWIPREIWSKFCVQWKLQGHLSRHSNIRGWDRDRKWKDQCGLWCTRRMKITGKLKRRSTYILKVWWEVRYTLDEPAHHRNPDRYGAGSIINNCWLIIYWMIINQDLLTFCDCKLCWLMNENCDTRCNIFTKRSKDIFFYWKRFILIEDWKDYFNINRLKISHKCPCSLCICICLVCCNCSPGFVLFKKMYLLFSSQFSMQHLYIYTDDHQNTCVTCLQLHSCKQRNKFGNDTHSEFLQD